MDRSSARTFVVSMVVVVLIGMNIYQYLSRGRLKSRLVAAVTTPAVVDLAKDEQVIKRFNELSYDQQFRFMRTGGAFEVPTAEYTPSKWLGVITQQNPDDVWIHQEIIAEMKPDFIVETGTLKGGGALLWATILAQVNPEGRVITIDIQDRVKEAKDHPLWKAKVDQVVASSTAPETVSDVKRRVGNKKVLFILDSDHSMNHVLNELRAYAPMVGVGDYLIVQDSSVNGHPLLPSFGPGPYEAIEAFLREDDRFFADRARERFLVTLHPKGYLKRLK